MGLGIKECYHQYYNDNNRKQNHKDRSTDDDVDDTVSISCKYILQSFIIVGFCKLSIRFASPRFPLSA